eukprot:jgi/Mesen1/3410/ME000192S02572
MHAVCLLTAYGVCWSLSWLYLCVWCGCARARQVVISVEYPVRPPLFTLALASAPPSPATPAVPAGVLHVVDPSPAAPSLHPHWLQVVRSMQSEVNMCPGELTGTGSSNWVLAYQLARLQCLLDRHVEVEAAQVAEARASRGKGDQGAAAAGKLAEARPSNVRGRLRTQLRNAAANAAL